jgi:DNA-directed RNA polymerase subunit RPC12/RpoP
VPRRPVIPAIGALGMNDRPRQRMRLRVVARPAGGTNTKAPPILDASSGTIDYICGRCGTVLMHANEGEVHGVVIECLQCGAFNATDMLGAVP